MILCLVLYHLLSSLPWGNDSNSWLRFQNVLFPSEICSKGKGQASKSTALRSTQRSNLEKNTQLCVINSLNAEERVGGKHQCLQILLTPQDFEIVLTSLTHGLKFTYWLSFLKCYLSVHV